MKIYVTESQFKRFMSEDVSKNNPYLNQILDKMLNGGGVESLSPEEREALQQFSQGNNLDEPGMEENPGGGDPNSETNPFHNDGESVNAPTDSIQPDGENPDSEPPNYENGMEPQGDMGNSKLPPELDNDQYKMFISLFPEVEHITVNDHDDIWTAQISSEHSYPQLILIQGEQIIEVLPFLEGNKMQVKLGKVVASFTINTVPDNETDMNEFIDNLIIKAFRGIIKQMLDAQQQHNQ